MLDLSTVPDSLLHMIRDVVSAVDEKVPALNPSDIMVVGAACRDVLHAGLGHRFVTVATHDIDLGLALSSWDAFRELAQGFPDAGHTGIRATGGRRGWPKSTRTTSPREMPSGVAQPSAMGTSPRRHGGMHNGYCERWAPRRWVEKGSHNAKFTRSAVPAPLPVS